MRAGARTDAAAALLFAALALVVVHGGGSRPTGLATAATLAMAAAGVVWAVAALGGLPWPRLGRPGLALVVSATAFVAWGGLTTLWSLAPDRSWGWLNRGLVYLAFLALGVAAAAALPRAAPRVATVLTAIAAGALVWALAGKVVPALGPDVERSARLRDPVGYWNALALLLAMSLPLGLRLAADVGRRPAVRAAAVAGVAAAVVGVALTGSRGGLLVSAVALGAWFALARERVAGAVALAIALPPAVLVAGIAFALPGVTETGAALADRRRDGAVFGVVLVAALAFSFAVAYVAARRGATPAPRPRVLAVAGVALLGIAFAIVAMGVAATGTGSAFCNPPSEQVTQDPERILETSFNNRCTWWREAWQLFEAEPAGGTGAGTYELARRPLREDTQHPLSPHDLPLQALSETGLPGFLLLVALAASAGWVVVAALRRAGDARPAVVALAAAVAAWAAHALVDMSWEYAAVTAPVFAVLGVLASARSERERAPAAARRPLAAFAAAALAAVALSSVLVPWLAERRLDDAAAAVADNDLAGAEQAAEDARSLNPLAVAPLQFEAALAEAQDRPDEALRLLREAVDQQPRNPNTWYELGRHYFEVRGDPRTAWCALDRAYALDSWDFGTNDLLKEVRAALRGQQPRCRFG